MSESQFERDVREYRYSEDADIKRIITSVYTRVVVWKQNPRPPGSKLDITQLFSIDDKVYTNVGDIVYSVGQCIRERTNDAVYLSSKPADTGWGLRVTLIARH